MALRSHPSYRSLWPLRSMFEPRRPTPPSPRTIPKDFGRAKFLFRSTTPIDDPNIYDPCTTTTGVYFIKSEYDTNDYTMTPKNMETSSCIPNVYDYFNNTP
ncbi:hypothetical protein VPH35_021180 [Triticum aestivum]